MIVTLNFFFWKKASVNDGLKSIQTCEIDFFWDKTITYHSNSMNTVAVMDFSVNFYLSKEITFITMV